MATIALYAGKLNQMPGLIKDAKKSVDKLKTELSDLQKKAYNIDVSVCDLSEVINSIQASAQTQENRIAALESFQANSEEFINEVIRIDNHVADTVNQNKENFYKQYDYLKPECEKSGWEKFCDGLEAVGEWCQKHWKLIVTAVIVVVSVVLICTGVGAILSGIAMGALMGAGIGGLSGGLESLANGGSFWEGFEEGAFSGAISGAVMGGAMAGLGQLGATLGHGIKCASALGKTIKVTAAVTKTISTVMGGFDTLAMMDKTFGIFGGNLADFNSQLHESALYNTFQIGVTALAVFTNGMTSTMSCFVAGTLVLTACGLVAIENIKAGDKVISTDPDTGVTEEKTVLEAFRRTVTELVHLTIGGEVITTTHEHPFYVAGKGFVNAGKLRTCDTLLDSNQNRLTIDDISFETSEEPTAVYNFKVEDYHTYFVGIHCIFVHNAECTKQQVLDENRQNGRQAQEERHNELLKDYPETQQEITIRPYDDNGNLVDYNVRVDEINNDFFNEVKATETAPYTRNQRKGYELLQRNGGEIRGSGKPGFEGGTKLGPTPGYTTRSGKTVPLSQDMAIHGGGK